jgi:HTH-type transcriptional regulator / antitoxin HipB
VVTFAEQVRALRKARGYTQLYLARRSGLSTAAICRYEAGERLPTLQSLRRVARALGVPWESLDPDDGRM